MEMGKPYFSVASGGGTGRTLHPDNMAAGPASYGMTDTMGRMHSDAQFAGSSSVPAHVEMMGFIGMGNNPMVGATVACAVAVACILNGLTEDQITVNLLGGDLKIRWDREKNLIYMTGPAEVVFDGELYL